MNRLPAATEMYDALVRRDHSYEGVFIACVRTTGIFCRPTCTARKPKAANVEFAASVQEALHRGYRPCRVCDPLGTREPEPKWLRPLVDEILRNPGVRMRDGDLRARGVDPVHVRRTFKRRYGMTFQAYQRACRLGTAMRALQDGAPALDAGLHAGFESDSGFRDAFARLFGDAPARARGAALLVASWFETPLGPMIAVAGDEGLALLEFVDRRALEAELTLRRRRIGSPIVPGRRGVLTAAESQVREYFAGERRTFDLPLVQRGSEFDRRVWRALAGIPYGTTISYAELARTIEAPAAVRAVGAANGRNQLAIVVPCHRVIKSDGTLCGYGGGRWRKRWLLDHEQQYNAGSVGVDVTANVQREPAQRDLLLA